MDIILISVTAVSIVVTALLGARLLRMIREERRRSDARVNLLMELAGSTGPRRERAQRFTDFELQPSAPHHPEVGDLFHEHEVQSAWPRRLLAAGTLATVIGGTVFAWNLLDRRPSTHTAAAPVAQQPLELLSLAHKQQGGTLVITGLVQNPRGSAVVSGAQATVLVFGANGSLIASGRAPLDFTTLAAGDESPFVIRVETTGAARYRVGFRGANDQTLAHVDRRNLDALARKETP